MLGVVVAVAMIWRLALESLVDLPPICFPQFHFDRQQVQQLTAPLFALTEQGWKKPQDLGL